MMIFRAISLMCCLVIVSGDISRKIDLVFLLDGSESVGKTNFEILKNMIKVDAESADLSGPVKIGVVQYSYWYSTRNISAQPYMKTEIKLGQYTNLKEFQAAVDEIKLQGYKTFTAHGINKVVLDFKSSERFDDDTTSKVMILVTDGRADDPQDLAASATYARENNIAIYAVGVGDAANKTELQIIANGQPGNNDRVYHISDYSNLRNIFEKITDEIEDICFNEKAFEKADLIFLIDGSASIIRKTFKKVKELVKDIAEAFDPCGFNKLGVVQYSQWSRRFSLEDQPYIKTEISLKKHANITEFQVAVNKILQHKLSTYTAHAINKTVLDFKSSGRFTGNTTPKIMIVITDGRANDGSDLEESARYARDNGIDIYAVGVGGEVDETELQIIANGEKGNNDGVHLLDSFPDLNNFVARLFKDIGIPVID